MTSYLGRNMMIVTHMRLYLSFNMQNMLQSKYYNISEKEQGKYLVQTRSQAKSSGIILPDVHGIDKGKDQNIRLDKHVLKLIISSEVKGISQVKPRLGQGRAGIKQKTFRFPMSQLFDEPEQARLLPAVKPIIQIVERHPLQQSQSKTRAKISVPESSITKSSEYHVKVIPVSDYTIPHTMSECESICRTIRKGMQDTRREILIYADPIHKPPLNQLDAFTGNF